MRRACLAMAAAALLWAMAVAWTGGWTGTLAGLRVSSHDPLNPFLLAVIGGAGAWLLSPREHRGRTLAGDLRVFACPFLASATALIVVVVGLTEGALVVGGSDAYGYVSQAEVWAAGTYRFDEPLIREFAGRIDRDALVPLGYHAIGDRGAVVPMYAPGFPMTMALFHRIGGRKAVFIVVPLLAGVAVWATYLMGLRLASQAAGLAAATLLATSPSFLFQLTAAPMSDIPVTAWWALALGLALIDHTAAAGFSGLAASLAILTRPNLAPLALIPLAVPAWAAFRYRGDVRRAIVRSMAYAAAVVPGCITIGILNATWYGSPLTSGYGSLASLFDARNFLPNLARYPAWVVETQTPIVLAACAAPWLIGRVARNGDGRTARLVAWTWMGFIIAVLSAYVFYEAFNAWWFVRFMLPAFPPLLVLAAIVVLAATSRVRTWARVLVPLAVFVVVGWHGVSYARGHGVFTSYTERKYVQAGDYVARRLPVKAAVLSHQHSGSIRYYSGRATVRIDLIPPAQLDSTLAALAASGYRAYFLMEPWEVPLFQKRYAGSSVLAPLDWPPMAEMRESQIRIYDPADRPASVAGRPTLTEIVP